RSQFGQRLLIDNCNRRSRNMLEQTSASWLNAISDQTKKAERPNGSNYFERRAEAQARTARQVSFSRDVAQDRLPACASSRGDQSTARSSDATSIHTSA